MRFLCCLALTFWMAVAAGGCRQDTSALFATGDSGPGTDGDVALPVPRGYLAYGWRNVDDEASCATCLTQECQEPVQVCRDTPACHEFMVCMGDCDSPDCVKRCGILANQLSEEDMLGGDYDNLEVQAVGACRGQRCGEACTWETIEGFPWSCVGEYGWAATARFGLDATRARFSMALGNLSSGLPVTGADMRLCGSITEQCGDALAQTTTNADGIGYLQYDRDPLSLASPHFLEITEQGADLTAPPSAEEWRYLAFPAEGQFLAGGHNLFLRLTPMQDVELELQSDAGLTTVLMVVFGCDYYFARDVTVELAGSVDGAEAIYGWPPDPSAPATTNGFAHIRNVPPGLQTIIVRRMDTREVVGMHDIVVRQDWGTSVLITPLTSGEAAALAP